VTPEVGARGGSEVLERLVGLNSVPFVIPSWPFPKHGVVKLHRYSGRKGCSVVVLEIVVVNIVESDQVSDDNAIEVVIGL